MTSLRRKLRNDMPLSEWKIWEHLRGKQRGVKFRRQSSILNFVVDFYCPSKKLVVEIDGDSHFENGSQEKDRERDAALTALGLRVLRFTNQEIELDLDRVLADIDSVIT